MWPSTMPEYITSPNNKYHNDIMNDVYDGRYKTTRSDIPDHVQNLLNHKSLEMKVLYMSTGPPVNPIKTWIYVIEDTATKNGLSRTNVSIHLREPLTGGGAGTVTIPGAYFYCPYAYLSDILLLIIYNLITVFDIDKVFYESFDPISVVKAFENSRPSTLRHCIDYIFYTIRITTKLSDRDYLIPIYK